MKSTLCVRSRAIYTSDRYNQCRIEGNLQSEALWYCKQILFWKNCCFWNFDDATKKNKASKKIVEGYFDRTFLGLEV